MGKDVQKASKKCITGTITAKYKTGDNVKTQELYPSTQIPFSERNIRDIQFIGITRIKECQITGEYDKNKLKEENKKTLHFNRLEAELTFSDKDAYFPNPSTEDLINIVITNPEISTYSEYSDTYVTITGQCHATMLGKSIAVEKKELTLKKILPVTAMSGKKGCCFGSNKNGSKGCMGKNKNLMAGGAALGGNQGCVPGNSCAGSSYGCLSMPPTGCGGTGGGCFSNPLFRVLWNLMALFFLLWLILAILCNMDGSLVDGSLWSDDDLIEEAESIEETPEDPEVVVVESGGTSVEGTAITISVMDHIIIDRDVVTIMMNNEILAEDLELTAAEFHIGANNLLRGKINILKIIPISTGINDKLKECTARLYYIDECTSDTSEYFKMRMKEAEVGQYYIYVKDEPCESDTE